jgi:outer membrane immunogenic protein
VKVVRAPVPVAISWNGFYVGINGGWAWGTGNNGQAVPSSGAFDPGPFFAGNTSSTGMIGAHAGYNWQMNPRWVLGLEADFDWLGRIKQSDSAPLNFLGVPFGIATARMSHDLRWVSTLRGRIGYTWDQYMLYGTGGVAWSRTHYTTNNQDNGPDFSVADFYKVSTGWVAGLGIEYRMMANWTVRAEYLYYGLNNSQTATAFYLPGFPATVPANYSWSSGNLQTVRVGLSYLFNP